MLECFLAKCIYWYLVLSQECVYYWSSIRRTSPSRHHFSTFTSSISIRTLLPLFSTPAPPLSLLASLAYQMLQSLLYQVDPKIMYRKTWFGRLLSLSVPFIQTEQQSKQQFCAARIHWLSWIFLLRRHCQLLYKLERWHRHATFALCSEFFIRTFVWEIWTLSTQSTVFHCFLVVYMLYT